MSGLLGSSIEIALDIISILIPSLLDLMAPASVVELRGRLELSCAYIVSNEKVNGAITS